MSSKTYPHFRGITKRYDKVHVNGRPSCELCDDKAIARVEFAVSYMRGEDEHFRVCQRHMDLAKEGDAIGFYDAYDAYNAGEPSE